MRRKEGFSLVELLIVLAVMAALIATITPVALNAIRKAKATQVAQNLKTLASALENAAYVNGIDESNNYVKNSSGSALTLTDLGRDIDSAKYAVYYDVSSGTVEATVVSLEDVNLTIVQGILSGVAQATYSAALIGSETSVTGSSWPSSLDGETLTYYNFDFTVY
ncbi:hypothetical protein AT15_01320 [Kosmotoga arenicorallina S304]|uniref:N-terminal cleavage protein n=1 Tax=Kosmotoga arenicorallina S304 TaxID=1453497 RepID=A0A176K0D5_9BACT|nr:type II secretion system protein [Kosmotoga arenicorallina]OAA29709.1 hypothetical protein AT15_01320 [Kosmotoga arenicorallina S304]